MPFFQQKELRMAFQPAGELAKLQTEKRFVTLIEGKKILLIWHKNQVHAIESQCPHLKLPLIKGKITEEDSIICPFHKSAFDLNNGKTTCWSPSPRVIGPLLGKITSQRDLKIYPAKIENGQIMVDI